MPRGGARKGAGRKKGGMNASTKLRLLEAEALAEILKERLTPVVEAQLALAQGIKFMVVRDKKKGKFVPVTREMLEKGFEGEEAIEVWEKQPSVEAWKEINNRAYGQARKPKEEVEHSGELVVKWQK